MRHSYIDKYSRIDSYIHRLDPRIKIIGLFLLILSVVLTPPDSLLSFALYFLLIAILLFLSKLPFPFIFNRSLIVIPFVVMVAGFIPFFKKGEVAGRYFFGSLQFTITYGGLMVFWNVLVKSYLSALSTILFVSSTPFSNFLKALEQLKFAQIFIMVLSFMYRYIFVIEDELMKMRQAKACRSLSPAKWRNAKALANMLGVLFIRAYERGERVYLAMSSRGFSGRVETLQNFQLKRGDMYFLLALAAVVAAIRWVSG